MSYTARMFVENSINTADIESSEIIALEASGKKDNGW